MFLPLAMPDHNKACGRKGFQGLLRVCDRFGACSQTETELFLVYPKDESSVVLSSLIETDIASGM